MAAQVETFAFQAETKHLLDLMIHSLYTTKAIFLRELISNAPDALKSLMNAKLSLPGKSEIRLETDPQARTFTIHDNGIGMNREEVIANIGTIAKLGTREQARSESELEKFELVWEQFDRSIKEGVASDWDNKSRLVSLLCFRPSPDEKKPTSLKSTSSA